MPRSAKPFEAIGDAVGALNLYRGAPAGRIRLNVVADVATLLLGPVLPKFATRYPDVELDIVATNRIVDIVREGFDAGFRYGGTVPEDMIAARLSATHVLTPVVEGTRIDHAIIVRGLLAWVYTCSQQASATSDVAVRIDGGVVRFIA
jgi:DNA-binding transcriptional LysR family regulator